ncbi:zinc finger protein 341-like [Varroa jacobsoni]|uniref:zinc finger protein 341-like n=1 Tax=Varroa jacobsoni TaxID=62625 RepID=UPI000BF7BDEC|nr:zinc finger protein 341-like [Varroa jacobsoni]
MSVQRRSVHFDVPESPIPALQNGPPSCNESNPHLTAACNSCNGVGQGCQKTQGQENQQQPAHNRVPQWVFRCPTCQAVFTHFILLSIHTWSHSPLDVKVPPIVKQTLPSDFDPKPPRCFVCTLKFSNKEALHAHTLSAHPNGGSEGSGEFECPFCEVRFETSIELITHIEIGSHPWKDGDFYPIYSGVLKNHVRHLHQAELEQLIADFNMLCAEDSVRQTSRSAICSSGEHLESQRMKPALRKSTVLKPVVCNYQCAKCGIRFAHGNQLKAHVDLKHRGLMSSIKPRLLHSCVYCKDKFKTLTALRKHLDCDHFVKTTPARIAALPSSCDPENFSDLLLRRRIALDFENY